MRVLAFADYYLPGYLAGGPVRSISALVESLGDQHEFRIVTRDRDAYAVSAYQGIESRAWNRRGRAQVRYLGPAEISARSLRAVILDVEPDLIYLNSFFSPTFSLRVLGLRRARAIPSIPILLAPRGELSPGALSLKRWKKRGYLRAARSLGMCKNVGWHATSEHEAAEIRDLFGDDARVWVAPNLSPPEELGELGRSEKRPGVLRVAFLSRLSRKKNLHFALEALQGLRGEVALNVYGPHEDPEYREEYERRARSLPPNIVVHFHGPVPHQDVSRALAANDLFVLPTLGENFGHVIFEALRAGCPVLVSDRTPWLDLERKGIGWDVPLEAPQRFADILQRCVDMGPAEHAALSGRATAHADERGRDPQIRDQNLAVLVAAAGT